MSAAPVRSLDQLIRDMRPMLSPTLYGYALLPPGMAVPSDLDPVMMFREVDGTTLILPWADAAALDPTFPCRMLTLTVHSALDAVGFLAIVTARLAAAGISTNAVAAYHHDHLFVPADRADEALAILEAMAADAAER